jgi:8-oxo-dGTP pyrophosphatase MutT (NUDIX family)
LPVKPKIAATVVLLRERKPDLEDDCEFEVFMGKRHKNTRFMSEHHVFPGGALDDQDLNDNSRSRLIGIEEGVINKLTDICEDPANLWIIAIRELFEETGILIAADNSNDSVRIERLKKLKKYQKSLQKKQKTMTDILTKENLYYDATNLRYFGRLITPEVSPIRFDTQFFLCKYPRNQNINLFTDELTEGTWGTPKDFLEKFKKKQIKIIFPQYSTLQRLNKYKTIQEAFEGSKDEVSSQNRLTEFW